MKKCAFVSGALPLEDVRDSAMTYGGPGNFGAGQNGPACAFTLVLTFARPSRTKAAQVQG